MALKKFELKCCDYMQLGGNPVLLSVNMSNTVFCFSGVTASRKIRYCHSTRSFPQMLAGQICIVNHEFVSNSSNQARMRPSNSKI